MISKRVIMRYKHNGISKNQARELSTIKTIDTKGSILPNLYRPSMIHPLKARQHNRTLSAVVEKPLTWYLERAGVAFSMSGAAVCSLPASMLNTFATNAFFLTGDLFLLALWIRERRFWLIVQNAVFAALAAYGVVNNAGGIL
jgi:hypothetical protein